jgi:LSD1 subclass zinc finger protein
MAEVKQSTNHDEGDFGLDMGKYIIPARELRCPGCKRFLGYTAIAWGAVKIKCSNCKEWVTLDVSFDK